MAKEKIKETGNGHKKPRIVLGLVIVMLLIPLAILVAVLLSSLEDSSKPVVGSRYEHHLDPKITEENIQSLEEALVFEGTDAVEVNFRSARVAILIDASDEASADVLNDLVNQAYAKVNEILPIETYFTNHGEDKNIVKMYDLQIDAYNVIEGENKRHLVLNKTGAQSEALIQTVSLPKNETVSNDVQNQGKEE